METRSRIEQIYIASGAGEPMVSLDHVSAVCYRGLEGDRYFLNEGFWQNVKKPHEVVRNVSLISEQAIIEARQEFGQDFDPMMTRRNLVVCGDIDLMSLIGAQFIVGEVKMRGVEECTPCNRPSTLSGVKGFEKAFKVTGRAGIRAEILNDGDIHVGDEISRLIKLVK